MSNFSLYSGWLQSLLVQIFVMEPEFAWRAQTVSLNFLPTSSIPTKFSHLFAGKSSCRRRLQMVQPYVLAKLGPGVLRALKRAPSPSHLRSRC